MIIENKAAIPSAIVRAVAVSLQGKLHAPLVRVANGDLSVDEASSRAYAALLESHANAAYAGRLAAGDKAPVGDADRSRVEVHAQMQQMYFEQFAAQVADGKYRNDDGELNVAAIQNRAGLYALRLRGTASEGWATALGSDDLVHWRLGGAENSCSICPDLAENGPYPSNELPTYPGNNETPCLFNCRCHLESESGTSPPKSFAFALKFSPAFIKSHAHICACHAAHLAL